MSHGFGDVAGFFRVERTRLTFADSTETAMARADVTTQHERCGAIGPTLKNVWATRLLAYGVKIQTLNQLEQVVLIRRIAQANAQPIRFGLTRFRVQDSKFARQVMVDLSFAKHSSIRVCNSASNERSCAILRRIWMTSHRCTRMDTD